MGFKNIEDQRAYMRKWQQKYRRTSNGKIYYNGYKVNRRELRRKFVEELKCGSCSDCQQEFPPCCMDFDHVRGTKRYGIAQAVAQDVSWDTLYEEIAKCDLVCSNCHRIRHALRGNGGCARVK